MARKRDIEPICDRIYEAAVDPDSWPSVLEDIAEVSDSAWAAVLTRRSDSWTGWRISPAAAAAVDSYLHSDAPQRSITTARLFAINHAGFVSDVDHFSEDEYREDAFFQWANAHGFGHGAATGFRLNTGDLAVVQLMRRTGHPPFSESELRSVDRFRPHLARAAMLAARWRMERLRAATEALALIGLAAVVLSPECRVMAANDLAQNLGKHLIWLARDGLALSDSAAAAKLKRQVCACGSHRSIEAASSFPAWDESKTEPIIVHVIPLKGSRRDLFEGGRALCIFTDLMARNQPNPDLIREIFDFTAAEARVAALLAQGRSVDQIASAHGVRLATIRSQAKSILHKLGAHRQAEVVALLGGAKTIRPQLKGTSTMK